MPTAVCTTATPTGRAPGHARNHPVVRVTHWSTVEGWNALATWTGVRARDLGTDDGTPDPADLQARRDYHECCDVERALHPQTLVASGMDGHLVASAHGAPTRLHSPVKLGDTNTKYLTAIVVRTDRMGGDWSDRGYEWYAGT